jgi:4-amino-4-deoxy-L-arabinose transferase-like glycosyltransferase
MFTFSGAVVNTDVLLIALSSWATYLLLSTVRFGFSARRAVGLGLALGLGALTKPQVWFVLPSLAVVIALALRRRRVGLRRVLMLLTLMLVVCLMVCGWWFVRAQVLNRNIFYAELKSRADPQPDAGLAEFLWVYEARLLDSLFRSYWGRFGWLDTDMSGRDYYLARVVVQLALLGIGIHVGRLLARRRFAGTEWSLLVQGVYAATFVVAFAVLGFWVYRRYGSIQPSQGRYFLAPLVSQMTLLALGLLAFVPRRLHKVGHLVLQAGMILLNASALFGALIPRYYVP